MADNNDDPAWILLLLIIIFFAIGWTVWYFFHDSILIALRYVRLAELGLISPFDHQAHLCFNWLRLAQVGTEIPTPDVYAATLGCFGPDNLQRMTPQMAINFYNVSGDSIEAVNQLVSRYLRWAVLAAGGVAAYLILFVSKRGSFKTRYNLESFIKVQAKIWPVIAPIVHFNPSKHSARIPGRIVPDKLPLFSEAMSPEEWLSYHRIPVIGGIPEKERVRRALLQQMGPRWNGFQGLPLYMLGLIAAFALKGVQKRDESDAFLGKLSLCWSAEKGFRIAPEVAAEIKKILNDPKIGGEALNIAKNHAYRTTVILGILKWARFMGGVLAAAQFLWLRGVDRDLWYALNNLGRRSFHAEGAGAIAHYMAEENAQKALPVPRLETAIITINQYLAANQVPIPPREEPKRANV